MFNVLHVTEREGVLLLATYTKVFHYRRGPGNALHLLKQENLYDISPHDLYDIDPDQARWAPP